jgi:hypothetical protein
LVIPPAAITGVVLCADANAAAKRRKENVLIRIDKMIPGLTIGDVGATEHAEVVNKL